MTLSPFKSNDRSLRIVVKGVSKTFTLHTQGGTVIEVLDDVALDVHAADCVALGGPSGAGKSTLLRCLSANYQPAAGHIWVLHHDRWIDIVAASANEIIEIRKHTVGWVSQFLRVIPRIPTLDIVGQPVVAQGRTIDEARERASSLLRRLNVPERLWSLAPATFSGGEQQRVNVARGLAGGHPILLVDEPTASLDSANSEAVVDLLLEARKTGAAIVGIFHDAAVRDRVASSTFIVNPAASGTVIVKDSAS